MDQIFPKEDAINQRVTIDYQYFIQSALKRKLSWNTLAYFLTDLAPTLDKSREVIKILVQELEKWVSKAENEIKNGNNTPSIQLENEECITNDHVEDLEDDKQNSEDEIIENAHKIPNEPKHCISSQEFENVFDNDEQDTLGNQFHEFVGGRDNSKLIYSEEESSDDIIGISEEHQTIFKSQALEDNWPNHLVQVSPSYFSKTILLQ